MLKGLGDLGNIMKLQREMKNMQKKLKKSEASGASQDGLVKVKVNGEFQLLGIEIDDSLLASADRKKIEKAIMQAVNDAVKQSKDYAAEEMKKITGGMNIPGLNGLL
jgi:nucleoid-associated protein EbfC